MVVKFEADISEFDHGLTGLDFSSPLEFAKSLAGTDYDNRAASEQALYERTVGNEVNGLPDNTEIVSNGIAVWGNSTISRLRKIYELPNGRKVTAREYLAPVRIAQTEDTTEILKNGEVGDEFIAEKSIVKPEVHLFTEEDAEMPEPRYAKTETELSADRARKRIIHSACGQIRESLKVIALYDVNLMLDVAADLKAKIDEYVSMFS